MSARIDLPLEEILTSQKGFGLKTATPVQRAICRTSDGVDLGELWEDPNVREAFGEARLEPGVRPETLVVVAAIRGAKSLIAAARAIATSRTVDLDLPFISAGDEFRVPILAPEMDLAGAVFSHLRANMEQKFPGWLAGDPTADTVGIQHPSGRVIEATVTPLSAQGRALVGRWIPCLIFDEAPRMAGQKDGKRNLDEARRAAKGRILPGGQELLIGSPHAPFGPVYDLVQACFGRPSRECVVVRARGPVINPVYWTPERCAALERSDTLAYRENCLAEFSDPEETLFPSLLVEAAMKAFDPEPQKGWHYVAAMDPATRGNAWTFVVATSPEFGMYRLVIARQWIGKTSAPLRPKAVLAEIAELCKRYGIEHVRTDQHSVDALHDLAGSEGINLMETTITKENRLPLVENVRLMMLEERLELPRDRQLREDLVSAKRRVTINGVTLALPRSGDGRHADYVPAIGLVFESLPEPPEPPEPERDKDLDWLDEEMNRNGYDAALDRMVA